ncbi:alpha/beta fold hydrolase [Oceanobacillus longus]|uniref:Alpha/beta fold hydrolase n=1 Tax=Oceanobacillus longus TaxID=930120 RepID=A0ABV8H005_9BACI
MVNYQRKTLKTGDFQTVFYESGASNKEALIFLHGSGPGANGITNWKNVLEHFGENYHVIAPDLVGFGETEIPENTDLGFWQWTRLRVEQILQLMDYNGIEKGTLIGNSMGGIISLHAVMHSSDRFEKVILMGSGGAPTAVPGPTPEIVRMSGFYQNPTYEDFRNLITWFLYDESVLGDELESIIKQRYEIVMQPGYKEIYPKLFPKSPFEMQIPTSALRRMKQPMLLVHGYEDRFVPKESSLSLMEHLPNAELALLKECGHWVQIEKADRFHEILESFLKRKEQVR